MNKKKNNNHYHSLKGSQSHSKMCASMQTFMIIYLNMDLFKSVANTINKRIKSHNCYKSKIFILFPYWQQILFAAWADFEYLFFYCSLFLSTAFCGFFEFNTFEWYKTKTQWIYSKVECNNLQANEIVRLKSCNWNE